MTKFNIKILFFTCITLLFINNSNALEIYNQIPYLSNDTAYDCYITDIFDEGGVFYLKVRPIHFVSGLSAVIEARKDGVADFDIDKETKDTNWWVPNDYYIVDRDKSEFKLIISDKVKVFICDQVELRKSNIKELQNKIEKIEYRPFEIAVENGKVTIIQEIYIP